MKNPARIAVTALTLAASLAAVVPASAASDRPLSRTQLKKLLVTTEDLGKGWGATATDLKPFDLAGLEVDDAACLTAARAFDAVFDRTGQSVLILGRVSGGERLYTGDAAALKKMTSAAERVASACDGAGDRRNMVKIGKRAPGRLGQAAYAFEVQDSNPIYAGQDAKLFHFDYVVIRYRSAVAVVQGISGRASHWKDTLKLAKKAAAKLVSAYPRHA
ncbi:hypothetical protein IL992_22215 [Microbispora sp. NEAU-D428]|uniref:hypothetical protein n=1 Tax=Microbispora sitophila TaxID=2771537 RepID=UPI001868172B|nr:hypothetical protein [Microbispora sitophila]MBE3011892.1 hypothetical protein [Microbispora sitophila]